MKWHIFYIALCNLIAEQLCYAKRSKVGAVIVKDHNIVAYGYNGTPHGFPNICEEEIPDSGAAFNTELKRTVTKPEVIHAEINAIAKAARQGIPTKNSILYVSISPCIECAKIIIQSGITNVIYEQQYRDVSGIELLKKANVKIISLENILIEEENSKQKLIIKS